MIKRLIFDLDNTLIMWKKEYNDMFKIALEKINYTGNLEKTGEEIKKAVDDYEATYIKCYKKRDMLDFINQKINTYLPMKYMDELIGNNDYIAPSSLDESIYSTLDYLSSKYEMVILSNWFIEAQIKRLKKAKILKYFKELYGEEYSKPYKEAFLQAKGKNNKIEECVMIGDSLELDIEAAINAGIKQAIWLDNKSNKNNDKNEVNKKIKLPNNVKRILKIEELKNIL